MDLGAQVDRRYSVLFAGDQNPAWLSYVTEAARLGFEGLGIGDSPSIYPDVYLRSALALGVAPEMRVGPMVTNPLLRHPVVTAGAIASVDQLAPGKAFVAIGAGDSAAKNAGLAKAPLRHLADYARCVKALLCDGVAVWDDAKVRLALTSPEVPVYLAAAGPQTLRLAGRIADGVIVGSGISTDAVDFALTHIEEGASRSGRSLVDLDIWFLVHVSLADDDDRALDAIANSLVTKVHSTYKTPAALSTIPGEFHAAAAEILRRYDPLHHADFSYDGHRALFAGYPEFMSYIARRHAVVGAPATFTEQLLAAHRAGAANIWMNPRTADKRSFLGLWATDVAPALGLASVRAD